MRITEIREHTIPVSRYQDPAVASGGLTTSLVAVTTDVMREGKPVIGYGYASIGRFAQGGLIRERFAPRLLAAGDRDLDDENGVTLDPFRAWRLMMTGEKPGGHGERCVAVGALDMAIWDAAAKMADLPLYRFLADKLGREVGVAPRVAVYAGGGYPYPHDDLARLSDEIRRAVDLGFTYVKIKIGSDALDQDLRRIDAAARGLASASHLAVDAMNRFDLATGLNVARALKGYALHWFEDICDPLDFATQAAIASAYGGPIAAGEALFSQAEANLLANYGGLTPGRDVLVFDPVHCYGVPGYLRIVETMTAAGWSRDAFWPHGGHLFSLHLCAALGLGGAELTPFAFAPFAGLADGMRVAAGQIDVPQSPGIGFETVPAIWQALQALH
ncbi:mandelate racemase [Pandoraea fibrosis]|uniref:Mandelate racemase n=1 Tax=Pandoraea fibrosis TaxID=1891094 RepID=A0ABX6HZB8_9BURK|nr:enolase C-terminal domain-like protein [Pandoraea fibrosis]QHE94716.1 mandelate racemase [Pandoraea fibrosis]QHF15555.1 mandelate racemase [Pandoraea fibrosis]